MYRKTNPETVIGRMIVNSNQLIKWAEREGTPEQFAIARKLDEAIKHVGAKFNPAFHPANATIAAARAAYDNGLSIAHNPFSADDPRSNAWAEAYMKRHAERTTVNSGE